jgi:hypothetical protein
MNGNCSFCYNKYNEFTKGLSCINEFCINKDLCEVCSKELKLNYSVRECSECIKSNPPTYYYSYCLYVTRFIKNKIWFWYPIY